MSCVAAGKPPAKLRWPGVLLTDDPAQYEKLRPYSTTVLHLVGSADRPSGFVFYHRTTRQFFAYPYRDGAADQASVPQLVAHIRSRARTMGKQLILSREAAAVLGAVLPTSSAMSAQQRGEALSDEAHQTGGWLLNGGIHHGSHINRGHLEPCVGLDSLSACRVAAEDVKRQYSRPRSTYQIWHLTATGPHGETVQFRDLADPYEGI